MNLIMPKSFQFKESIGVAVKAVSVQSVFVILGTELFFAEAKNEQSNKAAIKNDLCIS